MFLGTTGDLPAVASMVNSLDDDVKNYPLRARQLPEGFQVRAFAALCHAPREEWSTD